MEGNNFEIIETVGVISESDESSWQKELNIIQWYNNEIKYDIRSWDKDHSAMSKGITLSVEELHNLKALLNSIEI